MSYRYATPVAVLQEIISSAHFAELWAAERIAPRGPLRDDLRALWMGHAAVAPWQKGGGKMRPEDYFPHLFRQGQQTVEEQIEICKTLAGEDHE